MYFKFLFVHTHTHSLASQDTFLTFLYNDEVHSYDEVIAGLLLVR